MSTWNPDDAHVLQSRWMFQTPVNAQDAARERLQPNNFQWLLYRPQEHAIPPFEYFKNTRAPSRVMTSTNFHQPNK
jgi:hypothetical protein